MDRFEPRSWQSTQASIEVRSHKVNAIAAVAVFAQGQTVFGEAPAGQHSSTRHQLNRNGPRLFVGEGVKRPLPQR